MADRALLIPTSMGCLEGVVSEPDGDALMAAVLLPGGGGRVGPGRLWRRLARTLADNGVVTLRLDYPERRVRGGARVRDLPNAMQQAVEWLGERTPGLELLLIGYCYGTRVILRRAAHWDGVAAVALINPHLRRGARQGLLARASRRLLLPLGAVMGQLRQARRRDDPRRETFRGLDPRLTELLHVAAGRFPVWILVGDRGTAASDVRVAVAAVEARGGSLSVEVVPGMALIPDVGPQPFGELLERVNRWTRRRIDDTRTELAVP